MRILADLALLKQIKKDLQESSRVGADAAGKTKLALLREKFKNAKKQKDQMTNEKEAASLRCVFESLVPPHLPENHRVSAFIGGDEHTRGLGHDQISKPRIKPGL